MKDLDFGIGASGKFQALLCVLLAVFMSALGFGILTAPMNMKPILALLLKAFIGLVFGGIAAICMLFAIRMIRGNSALPSELYARCLTCGERSSHDLVCPICAEPPQNRTVAIRIESDDLLGELFGALILTGVGCLGLFIMIGPYLDGERRWWALIAFFALGLLMFVVGIAGFGGLVITIWNRFRAAKNFSFACQSPDRLAHGGGKLAWGKVILMQSEGRVSAPLTARGRPEGGYRVSPGDMRLVEAIATFDAAGFIEMVDLTIYNWCVGDTSGKTRSSNPEFKRTVTCQTTIKLSRMAFPFHEDDDGDVDHPENVSAVPREKPESRDDAITRYLARYLVAPQSLTEFKNRIDADPLHRTQFEMHARTLRDRGIAVSGGLVEAVIEALLRETPRAA